MRVKKIDPADISYRRWPRTLNEAFGPTAKLYVPPKKVPPRAYAWMVAYGAVLGVAWYFILGLHVGA